MAYTLLFLAAFIIAQVSGIDYCQICSDHTLCLYNSTSSECNQEIKRGVTDAEIVIILDEHNKYRQKVARGEVTTGNPGPQPQAANMRVLSWDSEDAAIAQMWVRQCVFEHDKCRNTNGTYVGQNWYSSWTTDSGSTADWAAPVKFWFDEVSKFNPSNINPFTFTSDTGHYTQVVWANTVKIGCGYMNFFKDNWYYHYYACNYSPGGNIIGTEMYKVGAACSSCPGNCNANYNGLCNK